MPAKVQIIFYSTYGHVWKLAEAVAEGARGVTGTDVQLFQVAETLSPEILVKMGAIEAKKAFRNPAGLSGYPQCVAALTDRCLCSAIEFKRAMPSEADTCRNGTSGFRPLRGRVR
jgi:hypothetical protein